MADRSRRRILGISFLTGTAAEAIDRTRQGGLIVVPSGPVLAGLEADEALGEALQQADVALTDSGLMVLLWNLWKRDSLKRVSGLEFLETLLKQPELKDPGAVFLVAPDGAQAGRFRQWLQTQGIGVDDAHCYCAPNYSPGQITDDTLRRQLEAHRSRWIILGIGGCVQERLGLYLKRSLSYRPAIICTGAALGFLAGTQARIPRWADRLRLGWLLRCLDEPRKFVPRYWKARTLVWLMLRYGTAMPPLRRRPTW